MKRFAQCCAVYAALLWITAAHAQVPSTATPTVVASCGSASYISGQSKPPTMDTTGAFCTNASGGGGTGNVVITSPLGPTTTPSAAVAITDTGSPITGQTLGAGGQGLTGWLSSVYSQLAILVANQITTGAKTGANSLSVVSATDAGCTGVAILSAATNNSQLVGAAGLRTLCSVSWINTTATLMDVRLYDTGSAPTCSSATGVVANYPAQGNTTSAGGAPPLGPTGQQFANGIGLCITGANANNDNTAAVTGLNVNLTYK